MEADQEAGEIVKLGFFAKRKLLLISLFKRAINGAFFYAGWLVCMHQAPTEHPFLGPLFVAVIIAFHLLSTSLKRVDLILVVSLALLGTLIDSLYIAAGMITYEGGYSCCSWLAPLWITSLFALYAIRSLTLYFGLK